ncbi:MAG: hypothetical protein L6Q71_03355 [Planctomycetes bacterium]|nr:hypothetical protein [Planctomycetota bacterium]NUQ35704.1 hypothetical protein [Planctomycetaceae bacterium]
MTNEPSKDPLLTSADDFEEAPAATTEIGGVLEDTQRFWRIEQELAHLRENSDRVSEAVETMTGAISTMHRLLWVLTALALVTAVSAGLIAINLR